MKVVFKIFEVKENWVNINTLEQKLLTGLEDWGREFPSEEAALDYIKVCKEGALTWTTTDIVIQKVITI